MTELDFVRRIVFREYPGRIAILVLDAAFAALDKGSEMEIPSALRPLGQDMLIVIITHSTKLIEGMDDLYSIDNGRCIWQGSHAHLSDKESAVGLGEIAAGASPAA